MYDVGKPGRGKTRSLGFRQEPIRRREVGEETTQPPSDCRICGNLGKCGISHRCTEPHQAISQMGAALGLQSLRTTIYRYAHSIFNYTGVRQIYIGRILYDPHCSQDFDSVLIQWGGICSSHSYQTSSQQSEPNSHLLLSVNCHVWRMCVTTFHFLPVRPKVVDTGVVLFPAD